MELSEEQIQSITNDIPRREHQIRQTAQILCSSLPSPPLLVIYGVPATGKTLTIRSLLKVSSITSIIVPCRECVTTRNLLERAVTTVKETLQSHPSEGDIPEIDGRCESLSIFVIELQNLLNNRGKFILVFDSIDRQREASPTLLPALARLSEIISNLTVVFITTTPHLGLHHAGVPFLCFPQYTRADLISIVTASPESISSYPIRNSKDAISISPDSDSVWLWSRFVAACYDSLGAAAARDIISFHKVCRKLWEPFVRPILDKDNGGPGDYWPREFSKLMVKNRPLFQGETALVDNIVPTPPSNTNNINSSAKSAPSINLPYYAAYLLISSYIASHNPPKSDIPLLSKSSLGKKRKRRAGATATHSKKNRLKAHQKLSRRLLGPQPFGLERLLAIFHAVMDKETYKGGNAETMVQFATLVGLRLIVKVGAAGAGMGDALEGGGKWKCAVGWDLVNGLSRQFGFVLDDYIAE